MVSVHFHRFRPSVAFDNTNDKQGSLRFPSPCLDEQVRHDERLRVVQMMLQRLNGLSKLHFRDQAFRNDPVAKIVGKLQENWPTTVLGPVNVN